MPYVIETRPGGEATLHEMSEKELRESRTKWEPDGWGFRKVGAPYAHQWVRSGKHHSTDLWVDQGRIRKAKVAPDDY